MAPKVTKMSASTRFSKDAGSHPILRVALMACWGIGLEMLNALAVDERVKPVMVLTRSPRFEDPWAGAVMHRALELGIPAHSFEGRKFSSIAEDLEDADPDVLFVHAYPHRIPRIVYERPRLGTVNVHPSLLPAYRGVNPTDRMLLDAVHETGLTSHFMDDGFDTGPIIHQKAILVKKDDTRETIIERLKSVVAELMRETVTKLMTPHFEPVHQHLIFMDKQLSSQVK